RDTRWQRDRLDRERIDFAQQFDVSGGSLEFVFQPLHVSIRRQALPVARDDSRSLGEEPLNRTAEYLSELGQLQGVELTLPQLDASDRGTMQPQPVAELALG